nr:acetylornithine deacetylase [Pseudomonadota bacterium]
CGQRARGVSFATEAPFFSRCVGEVAVLGPGLIEAAHKGGEWLELEAARRFDSIIDAVIGDLCF